MNQLYSREPDMDIDPEIVEMLEHLRVVPERVPQRVEEGRARFLRQLEALEIPQVQNSPDGSLIHRLFKRREKTEGTPMNAPRFAFSAFLALALVLIVLFGGAGTTVYASQSALPGDVLYPVKTSFEQTQASLAADAVRRADLYLEFANHRLNETEQLIEQGRFDRTEVTIRAFERCVGLAIEELETASRGDPVRAEALTRRISEALARYRLALSGMVDRVPETVRERVRNAILVSDPSTLPGEIEITGVVESMRSESWTVGGTVIAVNSQTHIKGAILPGDLVRVHAYTAEDGALTAREIEQAAPGGKGSGPSGGPGDGTPNNTQTPRPVGTQTPGEAERSQERSGTHTPGTGDADQDRDRNRDQDQDQDQIHDQDRLRTHTPEPGDGSGSQNGDGSQNGADSGENCGDCSGGQNDGGTGGESGGQNDGSGSGDHDGSADSGSSGGEGEGDGGGKGSGGHN